MDRALPLGLGAGIVAIVVGNILEGGHPTSLLALPPILIVFGGTIGAAVAGGTMDDVKRSLRAVKKAFTAKPVPKAELVPVVVALADKARRDGLLALETAAAEVEDEFLRKGIGLVVDGTDPEELREILESELDARRAAEKQEAKFFNDMGGYAPTIGIIGTVMGLVHVLENLSQPDELGHLIAGAFLATLWGVLSANLMWLPMGSRLKRLSDIAAERMELVIEGVQAIQAGANPRLVQQRLESLLAEPAQPSEQAAA